MMVLVYKIDEEKSSTQRKHFLMEGQRMNEQERRESKRILLENCDEAAQNFSIKQYLSDHPFGAISGMALGAAAGSVLPGVGTILGGVAGAFLGGIFSKDTTIGTAAKRSDPSYQQKRKLSADDVPDFGGKKNNGELYQFICRYCEEHHIEKDSDLYNEAHISRAVFSKIRNMAATGYTPAKITVIALCIAMHLTLPETQALLKKAGYALSDDIKQDRLIAWCLAQDKCKIDVMTVNDVIYEKTGESPFNKLGTASA